MGVNAPEWALTLRDKVWEIEGCTKRPLPTFSWRPRKGLGSSGSTSYIDPCRIIIRAGTDLLEQRIIVVHELSHAVVAGVHNNEFWDCAWRLYARFGLTSFDETFRSEFAYKVGAIDGAKRAGLVIPEGMEEWARRHHHTHSWTPPNRTDARTIWRCNGRTCKGMLLEINGVREYIE